MSPLDLFVRDLDERKGKIPCCQEVTDIQTSVEKILKDLLLEVEKEYPFLKTTLINSGSFYEGTKVGKPDEFDYFVQLDYFSEPEAIWFHELPRSTVIVVPSPLGCQKLRELQLKKGKHGFGWKICVKTPFVRTLNVKAKGFEAYGIKVLSSASKTHGPAYCLELEWTGGERYKGLKISVDLSLAVKINFRSSTMDVDLKCPAGEVIKSCLDAVPYFFAVSAYDGCPDTQSDLFNEFKASALGGSTIKKEDVSLRCSQSCLEQALFRRFGSHSGPSVCLRVLKVLRDLLLEGKSFAVSRNANDGVMDQWRFLAEFGVVGDYCELIHKWTNAFGSDLDTYLFGLYSGDTFISSYTLKTAVLIEWEQNPAAEQWAGSNLSERLFSIIRNLRVTLNEGQLCSFFYRDYEVSSRFMFGKAISRRLTILLNVLSAIRDARRKYKFEECFEKFVRDLQWTCHKMNLYDCLLAAFLDLFSHDLNKVISSTSWTKQHFCSIYIQALLNELTVDGKLILSETEILAETGRMREGIKLFTEIASKRMENLKKLPNFNILLQALQAWNIAALLQFLCGIFKEDIEIFMNELSKN